MSVPRHGQFLYHLQIVLGYKYKLCLLASSCPPVTMRLPVCLTVLFISLTTLTDYILCKGFHNDLHKVKCS